MTIIQFPSKMVREWNRIEQTIVSQLDQHEAPQEMIEEILARMKEIYSDASISYDVSATLPETLTDEERDAVQSEIGRIIDGISCMVHEVTGKLFVKIFLLQVENYALNNSYPT